jgi:ketosteroid isomerase-like protein
MCPDWTGEQASGAHSDFDGAVEAYRQALTSFLKGDPKPVTQFFSRNDDVTLANPLGPPCRGPTEIEKAIAQAAAPFSDGSVRGFEEVSRYGTPDLGYMVQIERGQTRLAGSGNITPVSLRVTMIFRREGGSWKVAHRHADPIMTSRPVSTVIEDRAEPSPVLA